MAMSESFDYTKGGYCETWKEGMELWHLQNSEMDDDWIYDRDGDSPSGWKLVNRLRIGRSKPATHGVFHHISRHHELQ